VLLVAWVKLCGRGCRAIAAYCDWLTVWLCRRPGRKIGTSDNRVSWYDNAHARHIGYQPQDSSDVFRDAVYARTSAPDLTDPVVQYQGGGFVRTSFSTSPFV
jgi:hypothetical protein